MDKTRLYFLINSCEWHIFKTIIHNILLVKKKKKKQQICEVVVFSVSPHSAAQMDAANDVLKNVLAAKTGSYFNQGAVEKVT